MKDPVIYIEADWAAKVARLEARCDELNEACAAKQVLLDRIDMEAEIGRAHV